MKHDISEEDLRAALDDYNTVATNEDASPEEYGDAIARWNETFWNGTDPISGRNWFSMFSLQRSGPHYATRIALRRRPSARREWANR